MCESLRCRGRSRESMAGKNGRWLCAVKCWRSAERGFFQAMRDVGGESVL